MILYTLDATQKLPPHTGLTREEHRISRNNLKSPFSPPDLDIKVYSPALSGKGCRPSSRTSGGGRSHFALLRLERNVKVPVAPRKEAGIYLTLEGNQGVLSQFKSHVFPHTLEIRPDSLAPIQMSAKNQRKTRREFSWPSC